MRQLSFIAFMLGLYLCPAAIMTAAETDGLAGIWDEVTPPTEHPGKRVSRPLAVLTIDGSVARWGEGERTVRQSLFTLVPSEPDRAIDFVTVVDGNFRTTHALFAIVGEVLTIREGPIDQPRPLRLVPDASEENWPPVRVYKKRLP